jgi:hypothetical protein
MFSTGGKEGGEGRRVLYRGKGRRGGPESSVQGERKEGKEE